MTQIDWSKAPEGATHYGPAVEGEWLECWHKNVNGKWLGWLTDGDTRWSTAGNSNSRIKQFIPRPQEWTGSGLPPVGTVCEFNGAGAACPYDPWHPDLKDGDHVTIIAYFNDSVGEIAAFTFKARNENIASIQVEQARPGAFRPIRTPAQLAAEEREKAIEFMMQMTSSLGHSDVSKKILFGEMYDKGLRFEVKS